MLPKCHPTKTAWAEQSCYQGWSRNNNHMSVSKAQYIQSLLKRASHFLSFISFNVFLNSITLTSFREVSLMFSPLLCAFYKFDSHLRWNCNYLKSMLPVYGIKQSIQHGHEISVTSCCECCPPLLLKEKEKAEEHWGVNGNWMDRSLAHTEGPYNQGLIDQTGSYG